VKLQTNTLISVPGIIPSIYIGGGDVDFFSKLKCLVQKLNGLIFVVQGRYIIGRCTMEKELS
jgi:hypothetical protein